MYFKYSTDPDKISTNITAMLITIEDVALLFGFRPVLSELIHPHS
jgi:hypothetical protein